MPRRRSNSLPIPKIEVSIYQSPESKKKDVSKDCMEVPPVRDDALVLAGMWKYISQQLRNMSSGISNFVLLCFHVQ